MKMSVSLWLILPVLGFCLGYLPYLPPTDDSQLLSEAYVYEDTLEYTFFSQFVSWEEALVICQYYHSNLAVVDDINKAVFLASAIAESNLRFEDIWIGGRARKGNWLWYSINKVISTESDEDGFPPWVRPPVKSTKECLSMDRRGHETPLFLDADCRMKKPFICEKGVAVKSDRPLPSKWVRINDRLFIIYHGRISWREALSFCWQQGLRLAVVSSIDAAKELAEAMVHTRPDFESVWVAATSQFGAWTWVGTGGGLPLEPDSSGYPPWKEGRALHSGSKNCLVLDRHLCENATFIQTSCDRTRDFVCEEYTAADNGIISANDINFDHAGRKIMLILNETTWWEAERTCSSRGSRLAVLDSQEIINAILSAMADLPQELKHVWVGGRLKKKEWTWIPTNQKIPEKNAAGFPPWCETDPWLRTECLNLDKREHTLPLVYGLPCYNTQPFVCEIDCAHASYVEGGTWKCSHVETSEDIECTLSCNEGLARMGSRVMRCNPERGWTGDDTTRMPPQCQRMNDVTFSLLKVISRYEKSIGFLFVLDSAREDPVFTAAALQLVYGIITSFPLSSSRRAGIISSNSQSQIVIPYAEQDSCVLRHKLQAVALKHSRSTSFKDIVQLISSQTTSAQGGVKTIIFFLSSVDHHTAANAALLAPLKTEGHAVFTIDVGLADKHERDVTPLATVGPLLRLNHFRFDHALELTEVAIFLTGDSYETPDSCNVPALLPGVKVHDLELPRWLLFRVTNLTMRELNAMKKMKKTG